tara:strand:+ start:179 stop:550 length:372 start_codon:yes stop_codon:yes gene_type:complete
MKLYKINAVNCSDYFGTPENPIDRSYVTIIAQKPDCSAFLFLCKDTQDAQTGLSLLSTVPSGFDFTYCQEWGLTINDDVVDRVVLDLRKKSYNSWESQLEEIYDHGIDNWKIRIAQVKADIPK